ncbi:MAG: hypothetical protein AB1390_11030 [Nitrospirota bacterium]
MNLLRIGLSCMFLFHLVSWFMSIFRKIIGLFCKFIVINFLLCHPLYAYFDIARDAISLQNNEIQMRGDLSSYKEQTAPLPLFEEDQGICVNGDSASGDCPPPAAKNTTHSDSDSKKRGEDRLAAQEQIMSGTHEGETIEKSSKETPFQVYFFWGDGCPHCEAEKTFLFRMNKEYPLMQINEFEVWYNKQNAEFLLKLAKAYNIKASGVPVTFIDKRAFVGFSEESKKEIAQLIGKCHYEKCLDPVNVASGIISTEVRGPTEPEGGTENLECKERSKTVHIPWIGYLEASEMSLPAITIVIAGLDSFNPCAFFVLFSLMGLLIHAGSRKKMFLIGGIFVFFSGIIYFLFMAAWLNLFFIMGQVGIITTFAGVTAVFIGTINIKDFFALKKGVSLTIPDKVKPRLFERMRRLMKSTSLISIIVGTVVLAIAANSYELLCTAGFPMVFTRILTLNNLPNSTFYLYLALYNVIYVIPLSVIVLVFTLTLGSKKLTEWQGRVLKLVSGIMMLGLGSILIFDPAILNSALIAVLLIIAAIATSAAVAAVTKKFTHLRR